MRAWRELLAALLWLFEPEKGPELGLLGHGVLVTQFDQVTAVAGFEQQVTQ